MTEATETVVKKTRKPSGPRTVRPYIFVAIVTDENGEPVRGAIVNIKAFTKDGNVALAAHRTYRTTPGFTEFDFLAPKGE